MFSIDEAGFQIIVEENSIWVDPERYFFHQMPYFVTIKSHNHMLKGYLKKDHTKSHIIQTLKVEPAVFVSGIAIGILTVNLLRVLLLSIPLAKFRLEKLKAQNTK